MEINKELIEEIVSVTGRTEAEAKQALEAAVGDPTFAIDLLMGIGASPTTPNVETNTSETNNSSAKKTQPTRTGGVVGFSDMKSEPVDDKSNAYYAGGEKSGVQILGPPGEKKNSQDIVKNVFDSAKQNGAVSKSDLPPEEKEKFAGSGFVLGNPDKPTQVVPAVAKKEGPKTVILAFYNDCFTINDGPPRGLNDPANKPFLDDIARQVVPRELEDLAGSGDLNLELVRKEGDYVPPAKQKIVAFSGAGQTLGQNTATGTKAQAREVKVDESQPVTSIQIRLHDGSRMVVKFNHHHTVGDIRSHIEATHPTGKPFELRTTYPAKLLSNDSSTIKDEGLINASLVQRIA